MARLEREYLSKRIVQHYLNIADREKRITVNHFLKEKIPRSTIYDIIEKYEESGVVGDKPRTGRPKKLSVQQLIRLKHLTDQKTGISLRQIAPKFDVNISTISRQLKAMGITYRKRKRAPKYTDKQIIMKFQHVHDDCTEHYRKIMSN